MPSQTIWCLADLTGQVWRHADKAYLEQWVAQRNVEVRGVGPVPRPFLAPAPGFGYFVPAGGCAGGQCRR